MALSFRLEDYLWRLMNAVVNGLGRIINELGSSWCRVVLQVDQPTFYEPNGLPDQPTNMSL